MYIAKNYKNMVVTEWDENGKKKEENSASEKLKQQILIVDDSEINREILKEILKEDYRILEAANGEECLEQLERYGTGISLVLLDIVMPEMDGFEVLAAMNQNHWIEDIPVIMISSEDSDSYIRRAYEMGVSDYISCPFDAKIVYQRVLNMIKLYAKQRRLIRLVTRQIYEKERNNRMLIGILSQIVEFRNGESGLHVIHINLITQLLLEQLVKKTGKYQLSWEDRLLIATASALHDIGKIGVPDTILNKPTRLTDEEFAAIKSHTVMGADILKDITLLDHLVDIARNHHERYDGKGYPDGLVGEEIPLSARIVCVADSYDAMKSRRIYRNALPDEEIRRELLDNCGTQFDPQISRMFVDMLDNGMVVIDEDNPAAQGYRDNAAIESVADKFISEVMKTMSSQEKADSVDYLTGLYMRSRGQQVIAALMQDNDGCLAFIDMDNLKKVNDVHGHKAGDRALKLIGNLLAKETENETFAACRLGGDEFLIFMPYSDRASVESVIKRIFEGFESAREADCEIKEAALSAGLCMTTKGAMFESDYTKADKALYYVKQNCKGSYFFYEQLLADNKENTNLSADLRNVAKLLKESGSYTGALDLNYREFARIYEFVNNVGDRHNHNCYLVMVTMNTLPEQLADIEEIEKALDCMEQSIRSKIRKVDVCTRYSSMQYLIILFEPQENQIPNVMERIFMHYYELCDRENFKPQYEYIKMTEVK